MGDNPIIINKSNSDQFKISTYNKREILVRLKDDYVCFTKLIN